MCMVEATQSVRTGYVHGTGSHSVVSQQKEATGMVAILTCHLSAIDTQIHTFIPACKTHEVIVGYGLDSIRMTVTV